MRTLKSPAKKALQRKGDMCPNCGAGYAKIEGNGHPPGQGLAFLCTACEWQWDADDI